MTRLELREVIKVFDLSNINDIKVEYSDASYSAIVKGCFPASFVQFISEKYSESFYKRISEAESKTDIYQIDYKEDLIVLFAELLDHYKRQNGEVETEMEKRKGYMDLVNKNVIEAVSPSISNHEWMYEDSKNRDIYFNTLRKSYETEIDAEMRTLINDFDRAVNPFLEMGVSDEMSLSNLIVKGNVYTARGRNKRENCCYLELKDKNNSNLVRIYRNVVGFSYQLGVTLDDNSFMDIRHFYSPISAGVHTKGEFLCVEYWGKESQSKLTLIYNLTDETINTSYTEVFLPITDEQKFLLLRKLRTAVDLASEVTIANLNEGNCLNLVPRK